MRAQHSRHIDDHTTNYRRGKRLRRVYRRSVPGHYAPHSHIRSSDMLWINNIKKFKTLFSHPASIGGGEGWVFLVMRYPATRYREIRNGQFVGWWTTNRPKR